MSPKDGALVFEEKFTFTTRMLSDQGGVFIQKSLYLSLKEDAGKKTNEVATVQINLAPFSSNPDKAVTTMFPLKTKGGPMSVKVTIVASRVGVWGVPTSAGRSSSAAALGGSGAGASSSAAAASSASQNPAPVTSTQSAPSVNGNGARSFRRASVAGDVLQRAPATEDDSSTQSHHKSAMSGYLSSEDGELAAEGVSAAPWDTGSGRPSEDGLGARPSVKGYHHRRSSTSAIDYDPPLSSPSAGPARRHVRQASVGNMSPPLPASEGTAVQVVYPAAGSAAGGRKGGWARDSSPELPATDYSGGAAGGAGSAAAGGGGSHAALEAELEAARERARAAEESLARVDAELRSTRAELGGRVGECRERALLMEVLLLRPGLTFDDEGCPPSSSLIFRCMLRWGCFDKPSSTFPAQVVASYAALSARCEANLQAAVYLTADLCSFITLIRAEILRLKGGGLGTSFGKRGGVAGGLLLGGGGGGAAGISGSLGNAGSGVGSGGAGAAGDGPGLGVGYQPMDAIAVQHNALRSLEDKLLAVRAESFSSLMRCMFTSVCPHLAAAVLEPRREPSLGSSSSGLNRGTGTIDMVISLLQSELTVLESKYARRFPGLTEHIASQALYLINAHLLNTLLQRGGAMCTMSNALQIKSVLAQLEEFVERKRMVTGTPLAHIKQAADVLIVHKDHLVEEQVRKEVCPTLSLAQIQHLLMRFQVDEFSPDPVPPAVLQAITEAVALSGGGDLLLPMTPTPIPLEFAAVVDRYRAVAPEQLLAIHDFAFLRERA